jgi:hypothetical protein
MKKEEWNVGMMEYWETKNTEDSIEPDDRASEPQRSEDSMKSDDRRQMTEATKRIQTQNPRTHRASTKCGKHEKLYLSQGRGERRGNLDTDPPHIRRASSHGFVRLKKKRTNPRLSVKIRVRLPCFLLFPP